MENAPINRDTLGRMVREAWVRWAQQQPSPKPSWLVPYAELSEPDKEADRQIGETMFLWSKIHIEASASLTETQHTSTLWCVNICGPNDVIATGSYLEAVQVANAFNGWWRRHCTDNPFDEVLNARMWGAPMRWPHDAASHAESVSAAPSGEYAAFFSKTEATASEREVPQPQAMQWATRLMRRSDSVHMSGYNYSGSDAELDRVVAIYLTRASLTAPVEETVEPVAWRCKDYADGWIIYQNLTDAEECQRAMGCLMQPLYAASAASPSIAGEEQ